MFKKKRLEELNKQDILEIISLYREYDEKTISRILNFSPSIVSQIITNYIWAQRGIKYFNSFISYYLFEMDYSLEEIANKLNIGTNSVFAFIREPFVSKIASPLFYKMFKIAWRELHRTK